MRFIVKTLVAGALLMQSAGLYAQEYSVQLKEKEVYNGYIVKKVWLKNYAIPEVHLLSESYNPAEKKADSLLNLKMDVRIGMERKKPFAVIYIPAYKKDAAGAVMQVNELTLTVTEPSTTTNAYAAKQTADVTESALASGTWYKIAVPQTGFFKIDPDFVRSMGVDPSTVNPANIRVFGNGGRMLPEENYKPRITDLAENALLVSDNGDNIFNGTDYAIFYGVGPTGWDANASTGYFTHVKNLYSDSAYYFVTFDKGAGLRISSTDAAGTGNVTVNTYNYYDVHDVDLSNPGGIGKIWYGELFNPLSGSLTQNFAFDIGATVTNVYCTAQVAAIGPAGNTFNLSINGTTPGPLVYGIGTTESTVILIKGQAWTAPVNSSVVNVSVNFAPSSSTSVGYLDYLEINARRPLVVTGDQLSFRDLASVGSGNVASYQVQNANSSTRIWDVTNAQVPVQMNGTLSGSTYTFTREASVLREFAAMNSTNVYKPTYMGTVTNQNLHGLPQVNNIIVTHPDFLTQANELAAYHRQHDGMSVAVVTTDQVYNEFSSGGQDISAIRDFARMFYKRAGADSAQMPEYLTLIGGASYDYKHRLANNSNYIPVFESKESSYNLASYSTDDFYGFLDDSEAIEENLRLNALDIGIGRLPARSTGDAEAMVTKITGYKSAATLGPWRLASTLVADNNDGAGNHMQDAEYMGDIVTGVTHNLYNYSKVYLDAIPTISTPAGERCPNANASISDRIYKGTFFVNYSGHGNTQVWTEERILTQDDYNKWNNANMLPFMVTATCDFGQFDHPQYVSAAEQLVLHKSGGVISILTTTAPVYATYNTPLNSIFLTAQFTQRLDGRWNTFGDASRIGKNATYHTSINPSELANYRKFSLLGDPALTPDFPEEFIAVDTVIDAYTETTADTIKALGAYRISGHVHDNDGNVLTGFNGTLSVSFFDKPRTINTITAVNKTFQLQDNLVYKGKVSVTNGRFSYTFIAPKDINYTFGQAKISHYAENGVTDAAGVDTSVNVGGYSDHPVLSDVPPVVQPYINDSFFLNGGITGSNTSLFVSLYSETGINVSGNKLGHDLTAVLDGNAEAPYILNDYYETAPNTYQRGYVTFPITGLAEGKHTMTVTAWDVNNNSADGSVDFVVVNGKIMSIENMGNYPNPFTNETHFVFEHNHPDEELHVQMNIYNTAGALVKNIDTRFTPAGSRTSELTWDGTDNAGSRLPSGMYVYRTTITSESGYRASAYQKLVITR